MEKTKTMFKPAKTDSKIYACFEEHDTLKFMSFLEQNQNKLTFKGTNEDQGRKSKEFTFDQISFLNGKFKHFYGDAVKEVVEGLLRGESRTALIYGGDQSKKQKILIGESQNPGLLLTFLHQIFQSCYDKEFQDKVTIKLSCWQHRDGEISDVIGSTQEKVLGAKGNWVADDQIEGKVVVGIPEIIIRNLKSALKMIKIFMKKVEESREQKEQQTQTLVFTIKLEIDNAFDKQSNTTEYLLSKFHIVKLANPYYSKNASKHPQWFISLFNYLQSEVLDKSHKIDEQNGQDSQLSLYLRDIIKSSHGILNFTCFSNKTTSNECLTALKFNSYLQHIKTQGRGIKIDLIALKQQQISLQGELAKAEGDEKHWMKGEQSAWLKEQQYETNHQLQELMKRNIKIMQLNNMLEYQYANVFTIACDKLEKYIFNEEIQDYFYAKKIDVDISPQLKNALLKFFTCKRQIIEIQNKLIKRVHNVITKLKRQNTDDRQSRYMLNSKTKEKQLFQKLFDLYNTLSTHYLYEENDVFTSFLTNYQQTLQKEVPKPIQEPIIPYEPTFFANYQIEKQNNKAQQPPPVALKQLIKKKRNLDETEMMFTNTNASLCGRRFKNGA